MVKMWVPPETCSYCGKKTKDLPDVTRVYGEVICKGCKLWGDHIFSGRQSAEEKPEPEKASPMAADSRGLHEKYFPDG